MTGVQTCALPIWLRFRERDETRVPPRELLRIDACWSVAVGFGLVDMSADEIVDQFPEMFRLKNKCRFNDCKHINEPGCAVKAAVENGDIAASRYNSYIDMVNGVEEESPYRLD